MNTVITIEYFIGILIMIYIIGLIVVWAYDIKRNKIYQGMKRQSSNLESLHLSMAVLHAKKYKIMEDYRRDISMVERVQHFILENLLLIRRRTLKS